MNISWLGLSSIKIQTKNLGEEIIIVTDPFSSTVGLKPPRLKASIALISDKSAPESNNISSVMGDPFVIDSPGEYEIKGTFIYGIAQENENGPTGANIFAIKTEQITLVHLGFISQKTLSSQQLEAIGQADIIFVPVGGGQGPTAAEAVKILSALEPRIIIPIHYKQKGLKIKLDTLEAFLKESGAKDPETLDKLKIQYIKYN